MAAGQKKTSGKKSTGRKRESAKAREARLRAQRQAQAILLMAVGVLCCALVFFKGEGFWLMAHEAMFGLLGACAYGAAFIPVYLAAVLASESRYPTFKSKAVFLSLLALFIGAVLQVIGAGVPEAEGFMNTVAELYVQGVALEGGGLLGAALGAPLLAACGKTGSLVILGLGIFILIMFITGATLVGLYSNVVEKPARKVEDVYNSTLDGISRHMAEAENEPRRKRFNIDVPLPTPPGEDPLAGQEEEEEPRPRKKPAARQADFLDVEKGPAPKVIKNIEPEEPAAEIREEVAEPAAERAEKAPAADPLERPEEPDNQYIDEIIRRMAQKQAAKAQADAPAAEPPAPPAAPVVPPVSAAGETEPARTEEEGQEALGQPAPAAEERDYIFPSITLLTEPQSRSTAVDNEELRANAQRLVDTLQSFGVQTRIIDISRGPAVTRYELQPSAGVKISKITGLADDIALNLAAAGVRIEAPIPGKPAVGIEVPNRDIATVTLREVVDSGAFVEAKSKLSVALGRDIAGNIALADLAKMPHVLIAGSTGSGKSVCINSIIMSILYKASDKEVKLLMIDPKVVELGVYNGIPHLLVPVVTDPKKAAGALNWAVGEMLRRYKTFAENNVRDLESYNEMARTHETLPTMPQIVIIIDELSDLMMAAPKDVEDAICRLAQMARAAGMHLVIATQRPSVDVITGIIKANVPSRIAFAVSSQVDSRTILDASGAEKLLGRGDMLYAPVGSSKPLRVQGCFVSNKEVERVVEFIKEGQNQSYDSGVMEEIERNIPAEKGKGGDSSGGGFEENDEMLMDAIECVVEAGQASTSMIQRRLKVGYARAGRLVDEMEEMGIVGPFEGSKPRQVLISKERWYEMKLQQSN